MHKHQVGHLRDGVSIGSKKWCVVEGKYSTMLEQEQEQHINTNT